MNVLTLLLTIAGGVLAVSAAALSLYGVIGAPLGLCIFFGVTLAFVAAMLVEV